MMKCPHLSLPRWALWVIGGLLLVYLGVQLSPVDSHGTFVWLANGAALSLLLSLWLLEVRSKNSAVAASEQRLRRILDLAATGFALCTPQGNLTEVNPYLCRKLGYSREELLGMNIKALTHADDWGLATTQLEALRRGTLSHYSTERRYLSKDGHTLLCTLNISLLHHGPHAEDELIIHVNDISERRADEPMS